MRYQELTRRPPERYSDTDVATLFVPHEAASKLLSLCARYNAQILSAQALAKVYAGFSVEVLSPDYTGSELLAGWTDITRVLEAGRA